jgi:hypothetical protein
MVFAPGLARLSPFDLKKLIIAAALNQSQSTVAGWDHFGLCNCVRCIGNSRHPFTINPDGGI